MDPAYTSAFVFAIENLFQTMLNQGVRMLEPSVSTSFSNQHDVSGIIGLSGDVIGNVVVSFPLATAEKLVTSFAGTPVTAEDPDFSDAIGEITNMISGSAKARFPGVNASISCPSVVVGPGHKVFRKHDFPVVEIPCECDSGPFVVQVTLKEAVQADEESAAARNAA